LIIVFTLVLAFFVAGMPTPALATGPAFTGIVAKADTAETVSLNPAGMTRLKRPSLYGNPMIMYVNSNTEATIEGVEGKKKLNDSSIVFLPGIYYCRPVNDRWSVGIGPSGGSGIGTSYGNDWAGRYILDEWSQYFVGVAGSAAYRVNEKLSLGISLSVNYSQFTLKKAVANLPPGEPDGEYELEADGWAVGGNFGMLYEFTPQTRFGFVYRSELESTNDGEPDFSGLTPERETLLRQAGILNQDVSVDTNQPQIVIAGIFHDFANKWAMTLDAGWIDFSSWNIDNVEIGDTEIAKQSTDYQDIWVCTLGATYDWKPKWTLRSGIAYISSGVKKKDRTLFTRLDRMLGIGGGVEYHFNQKRSLAVDLTFMILGDGEFNIEDATLGGDIKGKYDEHYSVVLGISNIW
jgi:long-chain fatty acid transport protein